MSVDVPDDLRRRQSGVVVIRRQVKDLGLPVAEAIYRFYLVQSM
jgi:hypothetical protein